MERDHRDYHFWTRRIETVEAQIEKYEDALTALASDVQSYSLNTGQTTQSVTKRDVAQLQTTLDALLSRRAFCYSQRDGQGFIQRPGF